MRSSLSSFFVLRSSFFVLRLTRSLTHSLILSILYDTIRSTGTNRARLDFLDDIALMRKTQADLFVEISKSLTKPSTGEDDSNAVSFPTFSNEDVGSQSSSNSNSNNSSINDADDYSDDFSNDDSKNSAHMVEATIKNAVEKTMTSFSSLLKVFFEDDERLDDSTFLFFDLPMGMVLSSINMFYDQMITSLVPTLVITNKAGIELLTLVPYIRNESTGSVEEDSDPELSKQGITFSRSNVDKNIRFGRGGLPMSVLASDKNADKDLPFRERSRLDDLEIGELEFFFSSRLFEDIIDDITALVPTTKIKEDEDEEKNEKEALQGGPLPPTIETSIVIIASCLSFLFTSEALAPFCRLTLEGVCYKNKKAMELLNLIETPSFALVAKSFSVQNLSKSNNQRINESIVILCIFNCLIRLLLLSSSLMP